MGMIFLLSSQSYEQQSIKMQLSSVVHLADMNNSLSNVKFQYGSLIVDGKRDGPASVLEFMLRKLAHITEYCVLSMCLFKAIRSTTQMSLTPAVLITISISASFAAADEIHQLFSKDRGPRPEDVYLDTVGAVMGMVAYGLLLKWKKSVPDKPYRVEIL
jgi:VanZ family protein